MRAPMRTFTIAALSLAVVGRGLAWGASDEPVSTATAVYRINAGGPSVSDGSWSVDTQGEPSPFVNFDETETSSTSSLVDVSDPSVPAGTPASIFQSERWAPDEATRMRWKLPVDPGTYEVRLYFAETDPDAQAAGARTFTVAIEGSVVLRKYDIFAEASGGYRGVMESFVVQADERLRIAFRHKTDDPTIQGIEVLTPAGSGSEEPAPTDEPSPTDEPTSTPPPPSGEDCHGVDVASGASIQAAVDAHPEGTTFCLSGTYQIANEIRPKSGQSFVGPAKLVGAGADRAFQANYGGGALYVAFIELDVSGFKLHGIGCFAGTRVIGGRYHHNLRNGIGCALDGGGVLIDGVELDHNGSEEHLGSGAAGMKFARGHGVVVRNSYIHDNIGNGVWCDVQCGDYTVVDNRIVFNSRKGVHYEKSGESDEEVLFVGSAYIARNIIQNNGWGMREHGDAGIRGNSSKNMLIVDNIFGGNVFKNGIKISQDGRLSGDRHGWIVSNVVIRRNTMNGDEIKGCDLSGVSCG